MRPSEWGQEGREEDTTSRRDRAFIELDDMYVDTVSIPDSERQHSPTSSCKQDITVPTLFQHARKWAPRLSFTRLVGEMLEIMALRDEAVGEEWVPSMCSTS